MLHRRSLEGAERMTTRKFAEAMLGFIFHARESQYLAAKQERITEVYIHGENNMLQGF
jgi:hypothetical protein